MAIGHSHDRHDHEDDDDHDWDSEEEDSSSEDSSHHSNPEPPKPPIKKQEELVIIPGHPGIKERFFEIGLVLCSLPFPIATLVLGAIRFGHDVWWTALVKGEKALPPNFPCEYFRGRTFRLQRDEFPQDSIYFALLPAVGTDLYIIVCTSSYILVSLAVLLYLFVTKNPNNVIRFTVITWAIAGCVVSLSLMVATAASTTETTISNQESYQKAVQAIQIFEAEKYGVVMTGEFGGKPRPIQMSVNNLEKGVSAFQAFRMREQCQALITIFQYCGATEVNADVGSPTFVVQGMSCEAKEMIKNGFCPRKSYFRHFVSYLAWTVLHLMAICIVLYFRFLDQSQKRKNEDNIPEFLEATSTQDIESNLYKKNDKQYYAPSHPDQYERLEKYYALFLHDFNRP